MKSNGKSNGVFHRHIDPRVEELFERSLVAGAAADEIDRRLTKVVDQLGKKFPEQEAVLMQKLEGQYARLLAARNERVRLERLAKLKEEQESNGTNGAG